MPGRHLTIGDRESIGRMLAQGKSRGEIAKQIGFHRTTVGREVRRDPAPKSYSPTRVQALVRQRRQGRRRFRKLESAEELASYVQDKLGHSWSPEQISGRLPLDYPQDPSMRISHEGIYQWIAHRKSQGGGWHTFLRQAHRLYRKRRGVPQKRGKIINRVGIEHRPQEVDQKTSLGHWESDTVAGSGSRTCLATHVERISKFTVLALLPNVRAQTFTDGSLAAFARHPQLPLKTLTADNGKEFAQFAVLQEKLGVDVYFARPYHAWERGLNENTNGLLRQFFPRGANLQSVTPEAVAAVELLLNNRPRKTMDYRTPLEMLQRT
jgi:transposase, IS30 family